MTASLPKPSVFTDLPEGMTRGFVVSAPAEPCPSGNQALDTLLSGGFPRGHLSEIVGPPSSGRTSLVHALLGRATSAGEAAGLVDPADRFDPLHAAASGIFFPRLLWVRPPDPQRALRCGEILLGTRGFGLVVLDLADGVPPALAARSTAAWARLAHRAASSRTALVLLTPRRLSGSFAHLCLSLSEARSLWPGRGAGPLLFAGLETRAAVVRLRQGAPGRETLLRFTRPEEPLPALRSQRTT